MLKKLKQYRLLIFMILAASAAVAATGYYFAQEKSEPEYLSKIDKLMFNSKNTPPKVILTLPDFKVPEKNKKKAPVVNDVPPEEEELPRKEPKKEITLDDLMEAIPKLVSLKPKEATQKLKFVDLDEALTETTETTKLPRISDKGKKPWVEYGKMVTILPTFKKVGIVIKNMGFDDFSLDQISKGLPSEISLSFSPYGQELDKKITRARLHGHETYMDLLLSSKDFLKSDSGPMAINMSVGEDENIGRVMKLLNVGAPVGGVVVNDGIADDSNKALMEKIFTILKNRGLLMLDAIGSNELQDIKVEQLSRRKADVVIETFDRAEIRKKLQEAQNIALENGQVLIAAENKPIIVVEIARWVDTFSPQLGYDKNKNQEVPMPLALVPISNLVTE